MFSRMFIVWELSKLFASSTKTPKKLASNSFNHLAVAPNTFTKYLEYFKATWNPWRMPKWYIYVKLGIDHDTS